jgi:hypothetical protein
MLVTANQSADVMSRTFTESTGKASEHLLGDLLDGRGITTIGRPPVKPEHKGGAYEEDCYVDD